MRVVWDQIFALSSLRSGCKDVTLGHLVLPIFYAFYNEIGHKSQRFSIFFIKRTKRR